MARTLRRFRRSVLDILPIRGKIVSATNGTLLVDLGRSDGITAGSKFDVVRRGSIRTKDRGPGITYDEKIFLVPLRPSLSMKNCVPVNTKTRFL